MADGTCPLISQNRNATFKDKFWLKLDMKFTQSLKLNSHGSSDAKVDFSHSAPNLLALASAANCYSIFASGLFKAHATGTCDSYSDLELYQYARNIKTWESHLIQFSEDSLIADTAIGMFGSTISFSSIIDIVGFQLDKDSIAYCLKVTSENISLFFRTNYPHDRDRLMYSLKWKVGLCKSRNILSLSHNPNEILSEIQKLVKLSSDSHLHNEFTHPVLIDLISDLLVQKPEMIGNLSDITFITTLVPLLEQHHPTREMCDVFIKHCRDSPASNVVVDIFTPMIECILKQTVNFWKTSWLRSFVVEYFRSLNTQNEGKNLIRKFLQTIHGPLYNCPHKRVLNNLVAVCLSGVYQCFAHEQINKECSEEHRHQASELQIGSSCDSNNSTAAKGKVERSGNDRLREAPVRDDRQAETRLNSEGVRHCEKESALAQNEYSNDLTRDQINQLKLFTGILQEISKFDDWCPGLASFLQPFPFPEKAMADVTFLKLLHPVIERFADESRGGVVRCLLHTRDDKQGWLHIYSPGRALCDDNGMLFTKMLEALLKYEVLNRKLKKFLSMLAQSQLDVIITLAVRENLCMINILKDMLQMGVLSDDQEKLQVFAALRCTEAGRNAYNNSACDDSSGAVDDVSAQPTAIKRDDGPKEFTLASYSTDDDLKVLLSTGDWSCLLSLNLSLTRVTSQSAEIICRLPNLKSLNLWSTSFGDSGLKILCDYLNLECLNLCETLVTDEGIQHLEAMSNLQYLNLNSTHLQSSTFSTLKRKLPKLVECDVNYTDAMTVRPYVVAKKSPKLRKKLAICR